MKRFLLAIPSLGSIYFYAQGNNILQDKLTKVHPVATVLIYSGVMFLSALIVLSIMLVFFKGTRFEVWLPTKDQLYSAIKLGYCFIIADILYTLGISLGASLLFATSCYGLIPVASMVIKFYKDGIKPNDFHLWGCLFGAVALIFIAYGDKVAGRATHH